MENVSPIPTTTPNWIRSSSIDGGFRRSTSIWSGVRTSSLFARTWRLRPRRSWRVALARALVIRPTLLLLDEPLSNLDARLRAELRLEIRRIQKTLGITTVLVTHDQEEALTVSDRVAVVHNGRLQQLGTPDELYRKPANRFVAEFMGKMNRVWLFWNRENRPFSQ